ncbi:MAG: sigma-54-dependent Fis family transcriptional regulator [Nitrospirae bacterium]|nr:sigma-54-dependent Fis family transcriptional regulator [Nitrospirota bacterium]
MNVKILVVDDEEIVRKSCQRILEDFNNMAVLEASSATQALELLKKEDVDIVLSDLKLPDLSGLEVLRQVKEQDPYIEVLIITGHGTVNTAVEAMKLGAYDYIEKPFRPDELKALVLRALERRRLRRENVLLKKELTTHYIKNIVGKSKAMEQVFKLISTVAPTSSIVLITGESGTGKELVARAIHYNSPRKDGPFVVVDCGSIPGELLESELFGHKKGAFTGAVSDKKGLVEQAEGGTLFLDEIGNLPLSLQTKLLRLLQEREYRPVGGKELKKANIRVIAATNQDLKEMVKKGQFREDLFYRLNIFPIHLPPLRVRKEDIPLLANHFLKKYSKELSRDVKKISAEAMKKLIEYDWPGNVRELENTIQRAILLAESDTIDTSDINITPLKTDTTVPRDVDELKRVKKKLREEAIESVERLFVLEALKRNDWNITRAAKDVGMKRPNFHALMRKYNIKKP